MPDGNVTVQLIYQNAAGITVHTRTVLILADGSQVRDEFGTLIASPVPAALASAVAAFTAQLDASHRRRPRDQPVRCACDPDIRLY